MDAPPSAGRWTLNRIVVVVLAAGFLFLLADTRLEHEQLMARKPLVFIPMAFSLIAFLVALAAAIRWRPLLAKILLVVSLLAVPVGLGGFWFHNEDRLAERGEARRPGGPALVGTEQHPSGGQSGERQGAQPSEQRMQGTQPPAGDQPQGERRQRRRGPPMLAPLAFLGMGLMGTLVTLRRWPADVA